MTVYQVYIRGFASISDRGGVVLQTISQVNKEAMKRVSNGKATFVDSFFQEKSQFRDVYIYQ
ncbi:MAG: hypothetical protein ACJAVN_000062 [Roseivirga sp.]